MNAEQAYIEGFVKRASEYGLNTYEAINLYKFANLAGMANNAIQSATGQKALSAVSGMYNKLPNQIKNPVQNYFANNQANQNDYERGGFTPNPAGSTNIASTTKVQNDNVTQDNIKSSTPGTANSPLSQITGSLAMGGNMPTSTFSQGTPVSHALEINNDNISSSSLQPRNTASSPSSRGAFLNK
jgi:hypothetical protein